MNPEERVQTNPVNVHVERAKADALTTRTESVPVVLTDVLMTGAVVGPDPEPERWGAHRRRDAVLPWVASVTGTAAFAVLVFAVVFVWGDR